MSRLGPRVRLASLCLLLLTVPIGVLVSVRWDPLIEFDQATTRQAETASWLVGPAKVATHLGDPVLLWILTVVLVGWLWRHHYRRLALLVVSTRVAAVLASTAIKAVVDRARPVFDDPVDSAFSSSFPSGHALGAAAFWATVAVVASTLWGRRAWVLAAAVLLPLVTAATRVLLGLHYLSDVAAGLLLGYGIAGVCTALIVAPDQQRSGRARASPETLPRAA